MADVPAVFSIPAESLEPADPLEPGDSPVLPDSPAEPLEPGDSPVLPDPAKTPRSGWKTGEQLEFLLSYWKGFKSAQTAKALDRFWPRVYYEWHRIWETIPSADSCKAHGNPENARLMMQKKINKVGYGSVRASSYHLTHAAASQKIKTWFNNRGRSAESAKQRGDLKLDAGPKRKLAAVQAYCTYSWSILQPIVLTRWEGQKKSATFDDDDDPLPDEVESPSAGAQIPLSFKLKIAREVYEGLTAAEKTEIDRRRTEDHAKLYRPIPQIKDDQARIEKLRIHKR